MHISTINTIHIGLGHGFAGGRAGFYTTKSSDRRKSSMLIYALLFRSVCWPTQGCCAGGCQVHLQYYAGHFYILKLEVLPYLVCLLQSRLFQCTSCTSRFFLVGYISYKIVNFPLLSIHCKHIVLVNTTCQDIWLFHIQQKKVVYNIKYFVSP